MSGDLRQSGSKDSIASGLALVHKKSVDHRDTSHYLNFSQLSDFYRLVISSEDAYVSWFSTPDMRPAGFACGFLDLQSFNKRMARVLSRDAIFNPRLGFRLLQSGLVNWHLHRGQRDGAVRRAHLGMIAVDRGSRGRGSDRNVFSCVGDVHQWFLEENVQRVTASTRKDNLEALTFLQALGYRPVKEYRGVLALEKQM